MINKEIKEIIEALKPLENIKEHQLYLTTKEQKILLDYITNLQEENERLKERVQIGQNAFLSLTSKINKAIDYIKKDWYELNTRDIEHVVSLEKDIRIDLLNILQGEDNV